MQVVLHLEMAGWQRGDCAHDPGHAGMCYSKAQRVRSGRSQFETDADGLKRHPESLNMASDPF